VNIHAGPRDNAKQYGDAYAAQNQNFTMDQRKFVAKNSRGVQQGDNNHQTNDLSSITANAQSGGRAIASHSTGPVNMGDTYYKSRGDKFNIHDNNVGQMYIKPGVVNNNYAPVDPRATSGKRLDKEEIPNEAKFEAITGIYKQEAFVPVKFLKDAYYCQETVCRIVKVNDQGQFINAYGTGFLVTKNHIMTNNHVIGSAEEAKNMHFQFFFEDEKNYFTCVFDSSNNTPFITEPSLDFTIISIKPLGEFNKEPKLQDRWSKLEPVRLPRKSINITKHGRCNIVGHPRGSPKLLSIQKNIILKADKDLNTIRYTADTDGGSSGSPVFDNNWQLIALHHKEGDEQFIDHIGGYRFIDNEGIRIDRIVKYLKDKLGPNYDILFS
jgi:V8-like Glu-specific endopeptidase